MWVSREIKIRCISKKIKLTMPGTSQNSIAMVVKRREPSTFVSANVYGKRQEQQPYHF